MIRDIQFYDFGLARGEECAEVLPTAAYLSAMVNDMVETCDAQKDPPAVGLAAPQIGWMSRAIMVNMNGVRVVMINPRIVERYSGESLAGESCFSLPYISGRVKRANGVIIEASVARLVDGRFASLEPPATMQFTGWTARVAQHEIDHLDGKCFLDRMGRQQNRHLSRKYRVTMEKVRMARILAARKRAEEGGAPVGAADEKVRGHRIL